MTKSLNVLSLVKEHENYVFIYEPNKESATTLLQTLGHYAADKSLSFTWYDAAILSQRIRQMRKQDEECK